MKSDEEIKKEIKKQVSQYSINEPEWEYETPEMMSAINKLINFNIELAMKNIAEQIRIYSNGKGEMTIRLAPIHDSDHFTDGFVKFHFDDYDMHMNFGIIDVLSEHVEILLDETIHASDERCKYRKELLSLSSEIQKLIEKIDSKGTK